jgi:hypothetical protein
MYKVENLIFIAAPRTCSSSFAKMLVDDYRGEQIANHHAVPKDKNAPKPDKDDVCFTIVRNHWDALVSWYFKRKEHQEQTFPEFITHFINTSKYVQKSAHKGAYRLFGKYLAGCKHKLIFEDIQKEWNWMCRTYGLAEKTIPHLNKSEDREKRPWQQMYDRKLVQYVWDHFGNEIHELQYYPTGF